jgi:colanic acid/amylovoran biosynthesis glycosyltransferase
MSNICEITYNNPCEVFISRHVKALTNAGCQVQLIARHNNKISHLSASIQEDTESSFTALVAPQFEHLTTIEKISSLRYLIDSPVRASRNYKIRDKVMLGFFEKLKPDLIHFHFGSLASMMHWIPLELNIPYTLSLRGSDIQVKPLLSSDYVNQLEIVLKNASGLHTVARYLGDLANGYLDHLPLHKVIYTTVPIREKPIEMGVNTNEFRFITVGRLHWTKAYVNLLLAVKTLLNQGFPSSLAVIGDGSDREGLVYWIHALGLEPHVKLLGKLTPAEISVQMEMSNGFIQSSIAEGFSNATAEAMAMGLPVFATNVGGTNEIIIDGVNGFLLDPFEPQTWYEKLQLVSDFELMKKISENAWLTANKYFSAKKHASDFIDFYSKVLRV